MSTQKLNLSTAYSDAAFLSKAKYVLASMANNPSFPNPVPPLSAFETAINKYSDALVAADAGTHSMVAAKNECRQELEALFVQLGMFVMYVANGNVSVLVSSGYTLAKQREPVYITNPGNVTLLNGITSGELEAKVKAVKGTKVYLFQFIDTQPVDKSVWITQTTTRSSYTFKALTPGKKYWVRVAVTGSNEQIAYSPVASQFVL